MKFSDGLLKSMEKYNGVLTKENGLLPYSLPFSVIATDDENYKGMQIYDSFGIKTKWKLLRGSILSVYFMYGERPRVNEYLYHFAYYLGKRFAKSIKKGGPKVLRLKSKNKSKYIGHHGVERCFHDNFREGFLNEYRPLWYKENFDHEKFSRSLGITQSVDFSLKESDPMYSSVYMFFLFDKSEDEFSSIINLISECTKQDKIDNMLEVL